MSRAMVGIDVGKGELDVSVDGERARRFANTAGGVGELLDWLQPRGEVLAVCEATGGYERLVVAGLREGGVAVPVAHPNRVRADARAGGYAAKTDGLDAVVLSRYGEAFQPPATLAQDADRIRLQDLLRRREQLVGQRTQEKNRLARVHNPASQDSIRRHIAWLDEEIGLLDEQCQELLKQNAEFQRQVEWYRSVPGVGIQTAAAVVAWLPELGQCESNVLAALCGVAPWSRDSGQQRGYRSTRGGRRPVRRVRYVASMVAARNHDELGDFYRRLRQRGKPGKVALVAVMRKLLWLLNAVARRGTPWTPTIPTTNLNPA